MANKNFTADVKLKVDQTELQKILKSANINLDTTGTEKLAKLMSEIHKVTGGSSVEMKKVADSISDSVKYAEKMNEAFKEINKTKIDMLKNEKNSILTQKAQVQMEKDKLKLAIETRRIQSKEASDKLVSEMGGKESAEILKRRYNTIEKYEKTIALSKQNHIIEEERKQEDSNKKKLNSELTNLRKVEELRTRHRELSNRVVDANVKLKEYTEIRKNPEEYDIQPDVLEKATTDAIRDRNTALKQLEKLEENNKNLLKTEVELMEEKVRLSKELEKSIERINTLDTKSGNIKDQISGIGGRYIGQEHIAENEIKYNRQKEDVTANYDNIVKLNKLDEMMKPNLEEQKQLLGLDTKLSEYNNSLREIDIQTKKLNSDNAELNKTYRDEKEIISKLNKEASRRIRDEKALETTMKKKNRFMADAIAYAKSYISAMVVISTVTATFRKAVDYTIEFDKALTEIAIVTGRTKDSVRELSKEYITMANELGLSTKQVAEAAVIYFQQGKNQAEVNNMVRATAVAAGLAGITVEDAASRMTSAMNAYKMESSEAMSVTDKFSMLAAKTASDFEELTSAFTRVGASANLAGVDMDTMLGILASNIETLREAPESIGTALINRASA